jgi:hypothetical protein
MRGLWRPIEVRVLLERLECWTALNRTATRRWLRGEATREATQDVLASTLERILRTFDAPPCHAGRTSAP